MAKIIKRLNSALSRKGKSNTELIDNLITRLATTSIEWIG